MLISGGWVVIVPITDVVKMTLSVADISVEPIIGTPLTHTHPHAHIHTDIVGNFKKLGGAMASTCLVT